MKVGRDSVAGAFWACHALMIAAFAEEPLPSALIPDYTAYAMTHTTTVTRLSRADYEALFPLLLGDKRVADGMYFADAGYTRYVPGGISTNRILLKITDSPQTGWPKGVVIELRRTQHDWLPRNETRIVGHVSLSRDVSYEEAEKVLGALGLNSNTSTNHCVLRISTVGTAPSIQHAPSGAHYVATVENPTQPATNLLSRTGLNNRRFIYFGVVNGQLKCVGSTVATVFN